MLNTEDTQIHKAYFKLSTCLIDYTIDYKMCFRFKLHLKLDLATEAKHPEIS